jgi:hypothetical protein
LTRCIGPATKREFDVVMAWSVDRLGRSLQDLVGFLGELHALGVDLFLHQAGPRHPHARRHGDVPDAVRACDDRGASSCRAGARSRWRASASAVPPLPEAKEAAIRAALAAPSRPGARVIAERLKVNPSTVQRISAAMS